MPVVDTHVHVMAPDQARYPRQMPPENLPVFGWARCDFSAESLIAAMDKAGVRHALLVQAFNAYRSDNSYVADMAEKYPDRLRQVCIQDAREPDALKKLDYWVEERGAVALRVMLQDKGYRLDDPRVTALMARAVELRVPVCIYMHWDQVGLVAPVLERHPDHPFALDHMASPPLEEGAPYASAQPLFTLARYPNLSLKFSSSTIYASMKSGVPKDWFELLLERFGPKRLMWGSNFPMDNRRDIAGLLSLAQEQLAFLSPADRAAVLGGNALRLWPFAR